MLAFLIVHLLGGVADARFGSLKKKIPGTKKSSSSADIGDVLTRVEATKAQFTAATGCLNSSRDLLFDIAATDAKKDQLKAKEAELAAAEEDGDKERITVEIQTLKDDEILRAKESGELEKKKLEGNQLKNAGRLTFNLGLAALMDKAVVENCNALKDEGPQALDNAKSSKLNAARAATQIAALSSALTKDIPTILTEAPRQIQTLQAFLAASSALRKSNDVKDLGEPKKDDTFQEIDF